MKLKEQAHSDLCIRMSEQMRSERATLLSESIRFECACSAQIIEVGAIPERQLDDPRAMEYFRRSNKVPAMEHTVSSHQLEGRSILLGCPANRINFLTKR